MLYQSAEKWKLFVWPSSYEGAFRYVHGFPSVKPAQSLCGSAVFFFGALLWEISCVTLTYIWFYFVCHMDFIFPLILFNQDESRRDSKISLLKGISTQPGNVEPGPFRYCTQDHLSTPFVANQPSRSLTSEVNKASKEKHLHTTATAHWMHCLLSRQLGNPGWSSACLKL